MIDNYLSTFSDSFSIAVLMWPLFSLLLTLPFLFALYRRDGWLTLSAVFAIYAAILYAIGLICFTLYPLPSGDSGPGITYGIEPILNPGYTSPFYRNQLLAEAMVMFKMIG